MMTDADLLAALIAERDPAPALYRDVHRDQLVRRRAALLVREADARARAAHFAPAPR